MDEDLQNLKRDALIAEVVRLRAGIREHRDSSGHELCWHHPQLWRLLPEATDPLPVVPAWPQFLRGCLAYRESLDRQLPDAPRSTLEAGIVHRRAPALRTGALAVGAAAVGACALGAVAIGALAIGRIAIGGLAVKQARADAVTVDELTIGRLHIRES